MSSDPRDPVVTLPFGAAYDRLQEVAAELGADATMAPDRLIALLREGKGLERALRDHLERVEQEVRAIEDGDGAVPFRIEDPAAPRPTAVAHAAPPNPSDVPGPVPTPPVAPAPVPATPEVPSAPAPPSPPANAPVAAPPSVPAAPPSVPAAPPSEPAAPPSEPAAPPSEPAAPPSAPAPPSPPSAPTLGFPDDDDIPF